jgi:hypothetical protein
LAFYSGAAPQAMTRQQFGGSGNSGQGHRFAAWRASLSWATVPWREPGLVALKETQRDFQPKKVYESRCVPFCAVAAAALCPVLQCSCPSGLGAEPFSPRPLDPRRWGVYFCRRHRFLPPAVHRMNSAPEARRNTFLLPKERLAAGAVFCPLPPVRIMALPRWRGC